MRRLATSLCSLAFLLCGILLSQLDIGTGSNELHAAELPPPTFENIVVANPLPLDLQYRSCNVVDTTSVLRDTVILRDTVQVVKYKYRARKKSVKPDSLPTVKIDTLYVPSLYVIIQTDNNLPADTIIKTIGQD